uniref:Uncharacterized protein n=1 Tax=Arundo donax TaxID=35708 RepID=A0A0A9BFV6_ARUDO
MIRSNSYMQVIFRMMPG